MFALCHSRFSQHPQHIPFKTAKQPYTDARREADIWFGTYGNNLSGNANSMVCILNINKSLSLTFSYVYLLLMFSKHCLCTV